MSLSDKRKYYIEIPLFVIEGHLNCLHSIGIAYSAKSISIGA